MKQLIASLLLLSTATISQASTWSLDSCISYAREHNINVRTGRVSRLQGEESVKQAKDAFLPTLTAGASQSFNFGRGLTSENTYANRNTSNFGWDLNMQLPLFEGLSNLRTLKYQEANLKTLIEREAATADDVELNVISGYLQALYCTELLSVADEQLRLSNVELDRRRQLFEAGKIPELDIVQAESQVAQDELARVNADNNRRLALVDLAQLLELPDAYAFDVSPIAEEPLPLTSADAVYSIALESNHGIRAERLAVEAADKNISVARAGYLPRLSFAAGLGGSYYRLNGMPNPSFSSQMRQNFNKYIGFSLSIPIFDRFSTRNAIRRARLDKLNAELQLENSELKTRNAIEHAYYEALAAEKKRSSSIKAREATHAALQAMQEKYNYGKANATEFEQAKTNYIKAASEAVQAKYEHLLRLRVLNFYAK